MLFDFLSGTVVVSVHTPLCRTISDNDSILSSQRMSAMSAVVQTSRILSPSIVGPSHSIHTPVSHTEHDKHIQVSISFGILPLIPRYSRLLFILRFKYRPTTFFNIQLFLPILLIVVDETSRLYKARDALNI